MGALYLANNFQKPFWVAPSMNSQMFLHPQVQESLSRLDKFGVRVLPTEDGMLACGDVGPGRLLEPTEMLTLIKDAM